MEGAIQVFGWDKKKKTTETENVSSTVSPERCAYKASLALSDNTNALTAALEGSNFGFAIWDPDLNLITANPRYPDLHKVRSEFLKPGINALDIMTELKDQGLLAANANPKKLAEFISHKLKTNGTLTSFLSFCDGTTLEVTADRLPDRNIVTFLRDASRDHAHKKRWEQREQNLDAFTNALMSMQNLLNQSDPLDKVSAMVGARLHLDRCVIWTGNKEIGIARSLSLYNGNLERHEPQISYTLTTASAYMSFLHNSPFIAVDDMEKHAVGLEFQNEIKPFGTPIKAALDIPILHGDERVGLLNCINLDHPRAWQPEEILFATVIAEKMSSLVKSERTRTQATTL